MKAKDLIKNIEQEIGAFDANINMKERTQNRINNLRTVIENTEEEYNQIIDGLEEKKVKKEKAKEYKIDKDCKYIIDLPDGDTVIGTGKAKIKIIKD